MRSALLFTLTSLAFGLCFAQGPVAPLVSDPYELVTASVPIQVPATPADRASALSLLERARQNADMHMLGAPPFNIKLSFSATGSMYNGTGEISELWQSGRSWRYDQSLAGYSEARIGLNGRTYDQISGAVPMRVHMLRSAMFWPVAGNTSTMMIRTAAVSWNNRPVTCVLLSPGPTGPNANPGRLWEEGEYCIDNSTGLLQVFSRAPGSYNVYSYAKGVNFHGRAIPDEITLFIGGNQAVDSRLISIDDGSSSDPSLKPTSEIAATNDPTNSFINERFPLNVASPLVSGSIKPVIVHAIIDRQGNVTEEELSMASDPALIQTALDLVKTTNFATIQRLREVYINVRLRPASGPVSTGGQ